ncbi:MAG: hypothetical protein Q6363_006095 [Candidatus Njordarchaeota archaeon]
MSSIIRNELEIFITNEQSIVLKQLRSLMAKAIEKRKYDYSSDIEKLMGLIRTLKPQKSDFIDPNEYIDALRSYAFILSMISELFDEIGINEESISLSRNMINLAKEGLPVGKVAGDSKKLLTRLGDTGHNIFINGCRKYINLLVGKVKEPDQQELQIVKEAIEEILGSSDRPYSRIADLARLLGTREKDLARVLEKIKRKDPNMILTKSFITFKDKMKSYLENLIEKNRALLVNDLAREWSIKTSEVMEILEMVKEIYPGLEIYERTLVSTHKNLSVLINEYVENEKITTARHLAAKIGIDSKNLRKIIQRISKYTPMIILGDSEILAHREKIIDWLNELAEGRPKVYIDEFAGRLGVSHKTAVGFLNKLAKVYSDVLVERNEIIFLRNFNDLVRKNIQTGKVDPQLREVSERHPEAVEASIYDNIGKILKKFEEKIVRR